MVKIMWFKFRLGVLFQTTNQFLGHAIFVLVVCSDNQAASKAHLFEPAAKSLFTIGEYTPKLPWPLM
jgi:hypothetical protein